MEIQNGENSDRLSNLPDHLLLHIMELMEPPKTCIQTCILSKRWKDLWKSVTMLKFNHLRDRNFVSHILSGRDNSVPIDKVFYFHHMSKNMKGRKNLHLDLETKLLEVMKYGASHNMKQLVVEVDRGLKKDLELPPSIFDCNSLTILKLEFSHPASHDYIKILFPKSLKNLPSLRKIHLSFLTFTTSENGCTAEPFSACKMLNHLIILCCSLQDDAKALCITNSNVSFIAIGDTCKHTRDSYKNIVFCTPKLRVFCIRSFLGFVSPPSVCNFPRLEEAFIDYGTFDNPFLESLLIDWLHLLVNVKIMRIDFGTLSLINTFQKKYPTHSIVPCFVRLKLLKVKVFDSQVSDEVIRGEVNQLVTCLLQNSLHAKVDTILYSPSMLRTNYRKSEED